MNILISDLEENSNSSLLESAEETQIGGVGRDKAGASALGSRDAEIAGGVVVHHCRGAPKGPSSKETEGSNCGTLSCAPFMGAPLPAPLPLSSGSPVRMACPMQAKIASVGDGKGWEGSEWRQLGQRTGCWGAVVEGK